MVAIEDRKYLDWLRTQPCIVSLEESPVERPSSEPAHLRLLGGGGTALKPGDNHAVPLHHWLHKQEQRLGPQRFWAQMAEEYPDLLWRLLIEVAEARYENYKREKKT